MRPGMRYVAETIREHVLMVNTWEKRNGATRTGKHMAWYLKDTLPAPTSQAFGLFPASRNSMTVSPLDLDHPTRAKAPKAPRPGGLTPRPGPARELAHLPGDGRGPARPPARSRIKHLWRMTLVLPDTRSPMPDPKRTTW